VQQAPIYQHLGANWCVFPSSDPAYAGPPSPQGEGMGAVLI